METRVTSTELAKGLSDILNRVRYRGERFVVERNGEPVAVLTPSVPTPGITLREVVIKLGDIPLPGDGFAEDLEAVQASQPRAEVPKWRS
ncbi:MAG: type II toxin-antitoxin system Phd/YefM family antitoxin [Chloroflexi bacterium]|nr:type II toxin-antitoxin system Phd/YefM family antitoxin [Chloroflexota bacterium]